MTPAPLPTLSKLGLLATLYFSQGLPFGFFTQALPVLLRKQGLSLPAIGLTSLLALPWALKFLVGPLVDRTGNARMGRRRSWIVPLQIGATVVALTLAFTASDELIGWLLAGVLLTNLMAATQDVATDGLAVELLSPTERGLGNGVQVAGYRVGMIVGGGALLVAFDYVGWRATFLSMAALLLVASVPILRFNEAPPPARNGSQGDKSAKVPDLGTLVSFVRAPGNAGFLLVLAGFKLGDALASGMVRPFFVDAGFELRHVGSLLGVLGFTTGLLGALAGGYGAGRLGRGRALWWFGILQASGAASYALVASFGANYSRLAFASAYEHFTGGLATAALFTAMMDRARPGSEATDYTLMASVVVSATGLGAMLSGFSAHALGYATHFWTATLLALGGAGWAAHWTRKQNLWRYRGDDHSEGAP